jgi:hypothetical protein
VAPVSETITIEGIWHLGERPLYAGSGPSPKTGLPIMKLAFDAFLAGQKAGQCRADIGVARRICAGATTCDGRATRRKRQDPIKLAGIHLRERAAPDPANGAQGE